MKLFAYIITSILFISCSPYVSLDKNNPAYSSMSEMEKLSYNEKLYGVKINTNSVILNEGHLYDRREEHWLVLFSEQNPILEDIQEIRKHLIDDMDAGVDHINHFSKEKQISNPANYYFYFFKTNNWKVDIDYVEAENGDFLLLRKVMKD